MKFQHNFITSALIFIAPLASATDIKIVILGASTVTDPVVFFGPPNNFCSPLETNEINLKYRLTSVVDEFSAPEGSSFFLKYQHEEHNIIYNFTVDREGVSFRSGYFYSEETLSNSKFGVISTKNTPQFHTSDGHERIQLTITAHSILEEKAIRSVSCPAAFRSYASEYIDLTLESKPSDAEIWVNGEKLGARTNNTIRVPREREGIVLTLKKKGYVSSVRTIKESGDYNISLKKP